MTPLPRQPRAVLFMDLLVALSMALALLIMISLSVGRLHRSERLLAADRAAMRGLESTLLQMQAGQPPAAGESPPITLEPLPDPAPAGRRWVRLSISTGPLAAGGGRLHLIGLVPASSLPDMLSPAPGGAP